MTLMLLDTSAQLVDVTLKTSSIGYLPITSYIRSSHTYDTLTGEPSRKRAYFGRWDS